MTTVNLGLKGLSMLYRSLAKQDLTIIQIIFHEVSFCDLGLNLTVLRQLDNLSLTYDPFSRRYSNTDLDHNHHVPFKCRRA